MKFKVVVECLEDCKCNHEDGESVALITGDAVEAIVHAQGLWDEDHVVRIDIEEKK